MLIINKKKNDRLNYYDLELSYASVFFPNLKKKCYFRFCKNVYIYNNKLFKQILYIEKLTLL